MNLTGQAEDQRSDEILAPASAPVELEPEPPPALPVEESAAPFGLNRGWLRLAYIFEFWIVMMAIFTIWSQVGGQGHLDLLPWYTKLACAVGFAWCTVRMTVASVENQRAWNPATLRWFLAVLAISVLMTGITYWYHLHEVPDEQDTDENTATSVRAIQPEGGPHWTTQRERSGAGC